MKKKITAREKREARKQEQKEKFAVQKPIEEEKVEVAEEKTETKAAKIFKAKKTSSKQAGLKSAFILSDKEVLMTSFGRGNEAVIEKYISGDDIVSLNETPAFNAQKDGNVYSLTGKYAKAVGTIDDPLWHNDEKATQKLDKTPQLPGMDILGLKTVLEKRFFVTENGFEDNIHIQMIYNILDIEKILAPHINDVSYVINNLRRENDPENDFIGNLSLRNSYATYCNPLNSNLGEKIKRNIQKIFR